MSDKRAMRTGITWEEEEIIPGTQRVWIARMDTTFRLAGYVRKDGDEYRWLAGDGIGPTSVAFISHEQLASAVGGVADSLVAAQLALGSWVLDLGRGAR